MFERQEGNTNNIVSSVIQIEILSESSMAILKSSKYDRVKLKFGHGRPGLLSKYNRWMEGRLLVSIIVKTYHQPENRNEITLGVAKSA